MDRRTEGARGRRIVRTSLVAIGTNLCLVAFKMAVGLLANSIAIVLDAMNNLSDALSSVITILGTKLAGRPPDKKHPFGYGRVEYLTAILIAGIVLFAGVSFTVTSVQKIFLPDQTHYSLVTVAVISVAIVTKLLLGRYTKRVGWETGSDALAASGADATFDAVIPAGTLAGALVTMGTGYNLDGWIGVVISLVILRSSVEMLKDTFNNIVGCRSDSSLTREIKARLCTMEEILGAYDLVIHNYGPTKSMGAVNVSVYDWHTASELHDISKRAQNMILREYKILLYIGFYAVNTQNKSLQALEQAVWDYVKEQPYVLSMHAFYEDCRTKDISFDLVIDFSGSRERVALVRRLEETLAQRHPGHRFTIGLDRDFSD